MLFYNMSFNFFITLSSMLGYFSKNPQYYLSITNKLSTFYWSSDIFMEICIYNRYVYVPHHIFSIYLVNSIRPEFNVYYILLLFIFAESTSFVTNLRLILKEKKWLIPKIDYLFFIYYFICRDIFMPLLIYKFKEYRIIFYCIIVIQIMSLVWTVKWLISIIKYNRKKLRLH